MHLAPCMTLAEANFPVPGLPCSRWVFWPTGQPINRSTCLGSLLRFYFRRAGAIAGAAAFFAAASGGEPATDEPAGGDAHDCPDDDSFEGHEMRMTTW